MNANLKQLLSFRFHCTVQYSTVLYNAQFTNVRIDYSFLVLLRISNTY